MAELQRLADSIEEILQRISARSELPDGFLSIADKKNNDKSLWFVEPVTKKRSKMILSLSQKGKAGNKYIALTVKTASLSKVPLPAPYAATEDSKDSTISSVEIRSVEDTLLVYLEDLIQYYVDHFEPTEKFGCCHRYKECSEARKCIHPDLFYAKSCWYRKNLEAGKIFY